MNNLVTVLGSLGMLLFAFVLFSDLPSTNIVEAQNHSEPTNATILLDSTNLGDKAYQPNPIEIPVWGSVSWTNDDHIAHSVTATEGEFDSAVMQPDEVFEYTFDKVGGFEYYCMLHPSMVGQVVVH
ncbi:MAG: plastocyanin/azurin family copper-binding protein [Nitrososphaeraceae archaeon]